MQDLATELQSFLQFVKLQLYVVFNNLQISNASSRFSVFEVGIYQSHSLLSQHL